MYDKEFTAPFKKRIINIWEKFIGSYYHSPLFSYVYFSELFMNSGTTSPQILVWKGFYNHFNENDPPSDQDFFQWCCDYLMENNTEKIIPLVEVTFNYMADSNQQEAAHELNRLFDEYALPYRFVEGKVQPKA